MTDSPLSRHLIASSWKGSREKGNSFAGFASRCWLLEADGAYPSGYDTSWRQATASSSKSFPFSLRSFSGGVSQLSKALLFTEPMANHYTRCGLSSSRRWLNKAFESAGLSAAAERERERERVVAAEEKFGLLVCPLLLYKEINWTWRRRFVSMFNRFTTISSL